MTHPGWGEKWASPGDTTVLSVARPGPAPAPRPRRGPPRSRPVFWTRGRRRNLRIVLLGVAALVAALVLLLGWVALDAVRARGALDQAAQDVTALQADAVAGRTDGIGARVSDLQEHAAEAREATDGAHWSLAGRLPGVGPTVRAVSTMAAVVDRLAQGPLPRLAQVVEVVDPGALAPRDGQVDLGPLQDAAPDVRRADEAVGDALWSVEAIGGAPMLPQVAAAAEELGRQLSDLRMSTATASRAAQLLPPMLGADGPRDYLVLVQNNAEPRALGGIVGTVLVLRADEGQVELVDQRPGAQVGSFDEPVVELTRDERSVLGGDDLGRWMQNVTATPDFPRSAEIAREMWRRETGRTVDGVLATDPVALAALLDDVDTGPGGVLRGEELVSYLLNGVYRTQAPREQDEIFADVAERAFTALSGGDADPARIVDALAVAAREGRLSVWSSEPAEAELLEGTVLDGALRGVSGDRPVIGVFTQGIQMAKIAYYVDTAVDVTEREERPDGSRELAVTVTYTSRVDAGEVADLPEYVTGVGESRPGEVRLRALVYAPAGGWIVAASDKSGDVGLSPQKHDQLWLSFRDFSLSAGETSSITYVIITGKQQDGGVILRTTPGPRLVRTPADK